MNNWFILGHNLKDSEDLTSGLNITFYNTNWVILKFHYLALFFLILTWYMRGRGRERENSLAASSRNPQSRYVPWPEIKPTNFCLLDNAPTNWVTWPGPIILLFKEFLLEFRSRKRELLPFTSSWMELEGIMLSEISQAVKDKYHMISPIRRT